MGDKSGEVRKRKATRYLIAKSLLFGGLTLLKGNFSASTGQFFPRHCPSLPVPGVSPGQKMWGRHACRARKRRARGARAKNGVGLGAEPQQGPWAQPLIRS